MLGSGSAAAGAIGATGAGATGAGATGAGATGAGATGAGATGAGTTGTGAAGSAAARSIALRRALRLCCLRRMPRRSTCGCKTIKLNSPTLGHRGTLKFVHSFFVAASAIYVWRSH